MTTKNFRNEKLQKAVREINNFGLWINPMRLSALLSNCKAERLPMCITEFPSHILIAIDVDYFEERTMSVNREHKGVTVC